MLICSLLSFCSSRFEIESARESLRRVLTCWIVASIFAVMELFDDTYVSLQIPLPRVCKEIVLGVGIRCEVIV